MVWERDMMRIVVGISGASGAIYGLRLLEELKQLGVESHLVISEWASNILTDESGYTLEKAKELASVVYDAHDMGAAISSGSFLHNGMVIAPCSMKTLAAIHSGFHDTLLARAADVTLKEGRKLVLAVRETPLNAVHLRNMYELALMGVCIMPPVPSFYNQPRSIDDVINQSVGRLLDQFGLCSGLVRRWQEG